MKENGYEYVDLGLPSGTMWANCNVGATKQEDTGLLFQFGKTNGCMFNDGNTYNFDHVPMSSPTGGNVKYMTEDDSLYSFIPHTASGKIYKTGDILNLEDDIAHVNMGGKWRMPTGDEIRELIEYTEASPFYLNDVKGIMLTSKTNSQRLFIPFSGYYVPGYFVEYNHYQQSYILSSEVSCDKDYKVCAMEIFNDNQICGALYCETYRCYGLPVRGVFK